MTATTMQPAANARCLRCSREYYDTTGSTACPGCGEMVEIASIGKLAPKPQVAARAAAPAKAPRRGESGWVLGLGALAIGVPLWLEGARTTRDGWVLFLNWVLGRLGTPYAIPASAVWPWWAALGALALLGYTYSHIEVRQTPLSIRPWRVTRVWQVWIVWIVFIVSDVGTMYLGARSPRETDPAILHQIAGAALSAAVYAILITFVPERLVLFGWHKLRG